MQLDQVVFDGLRQCTIRELCEEMENLKLENQRLKEELERLLR